MPSATPAAADPTGGPFVRPPLDQAAPDLLFLQALTEIVAFRNGTLQGAYFMLAARAVGLDVGGMSGFDNAKVDAEFFPDGRVKSNFLCNLGHGDPRRVLPRLPRLDFDEACTLR